MDRDTSKGGRTQGGQSAEQNENVREGFGDDAGTRVGRPDSGAPDDRSMARLSENADDRGIEGAVLAGSENPTGSPGGTERGVHGVDHRDPGADREADGQAAAQRRPDQEQRHRAELQRHEAEIDPHTLGRVGGR